jgi:2-dehydropantoate 2-reductase
MRDIMLEAGREAMRATVASGSRARAIFGLPPELTADPDSYVEHLLEAVFEHYSTPTTRTTVLQDWLKGRRSEVRELNGLVARELGSRGLPVPVNTEVTRLALEIEAGRLEAGLHNLAPLAASMPR